MGIVFCRADTGIRSLTSFVMKSASREHIIHVAASNAGNVIRYNLKAIPLKAVRSPVAPFICFKISVTAKTSSAVCASANVIKTMVSQSAFLPGEV